MDAMPRKMKGFVTDRYLRRRLIKERRMATEDALAELESQIVSAEFRGRREVYKALFALEDRYQDMIVNVRLSEGRSPDHWIFAFSFHKQAIFDAYWDIDKTIKILAKRVERRVEELLFEKVRDLDKEMSRPAVIKSDT
jgi:hypothetical protein